VDLPNKAPPAELEPQQGHVRNIYPAPNRKRPTICLAETGRMSASTNQRGNAIGSCSYVETVCSLDEEDSNPPPVTSSALIGSAPYQEAVQEGATPESGQMAATRTKCNSVEEVGGAPDEEDSKPSLVTSSELTCSDPGQDVVQVETTPDQVPSEIPSGWARVKLEPDC
jgi:hypothetical protein